MDAILDDNGRSFEEIAGQRSLDRGQAA